jgi:aspartyl/glutamyl-tRNA(Asn/Gln) amidotransferase C subunit
VRVDADTVRHMAMLARLRVPEEQVDRLATEMSAIVTMMAKIGAAPVTADTPAPVRPLPKTRADVAFPPSGGANLIQQAAESAEGCVRVPPVIDTP